MNWEKEYCSIFCSLWGTPYIAAINFILPGNPHGDTPSKYYEDMMHAGCEINNKKRVDEMTANTYRGYEILRRWDMEFAKEKDGSTKLRHVSGHTYQLSLCCTTYPDDIKENALAIAKEEGSKLVDIEFLEYEPIVVMYPEGAVGEPCPTAMLGEGAHLLNSEGERFMLRVRPQGEAGSPKNLINREIWKQVDAGKGTP